MGSRCEDLIAADWKSPAFVLAQTATRRKLRSGRNRNDGASPQVAMSFLGAPGIEIGWRRSLADAEDYAVEGGDSSGVTEALGDWAADGPDALGDWAAHVNEERLAASGGKLRLARGAGQGRSEFCFPDQFSDQPFSRGWLSIATEAGASAHQLRKARRMEELGLRSKARRQAYCGVLGARFDCVSFEPGRSSGHRFFRRYSCWNRYCPRCGPVSFRRLFAKYLGLRDAAAALLSQGQRSGRRCVIAKLDFTTRNLGRMPTASEVRSFNCAIRRFFRLLERRFKVDGRSYGVIWDRRIRTPKYKPSLSCHFLRPLAAQQWRAQKRPLGIVGQSLRTHGVCGVVHRLHKAC